MTGQRPGPLQNGFTTVAPVGGPCVKGGEGLGEGGLDGLTQPGIKFEFVNIIF